MSIAQKDKNIQPLPSLHLEVSSENESHKSVSDLEKINGTFQFQITKNDHKVLLYKDLASEIESSRLENEDVYRSIDEFVTLFIPSKSKIVSSDFSKLEMFLYPTNK